MPFKWYITFVLSGLRTSLSNGLKIKKIFLTKNVNYDLMPCLETSLKKKHFILKGLNTFFLKLVCLFFLSQKPDISRRRKHVHTSIILINFIFHKYIEKESNKGCLQIHSFC